MEGVINMSCVKRYLEDLVYSMEYDELYNLLESYGWSDEEIDELYGIYRD